MIIAVDGPAASGKGTIARALAKHYRLPHLDTGLLYRAVAENVRRMELDPTIEADAVAASNFPDDMLDDAALRSDDAGQRASIVSEHPLVRAALLQRQRKFANQPGGAVLDGRDIGTVIAPDADAKLFVKATPQIRARRRHGELRERGSTISLDKVLADIRARDLRDTGRNAAPLVMAADAGILDTSFLSIEAAVIRAIELVERQLALKAAAARGASLP
ncbi:(d)CMP kinase [Sphingomonas panacisoli]|uniref:Cytidylate kinase n=1 Tax=Sphingomonas panacisoli TaxID=1813879 RepID=A0A5B8LFT5_9SPHN|nr:d(CMP) kinase [Sphingomonas panacisoli]QDZ07107.1 (d)CMP kinase [Sphingomonas panacisoli]